MTDWDKPDVAKAQYDLVRHELEYADVVPPYINFVKTLHFIEETYGALDDLWLGDIGCGVGHYGVLINRYFPKIKYCGFDISEYMIGYARRICPSGLFITSDYHDVYLPMFSVIVCSSLIEVLDDWKDAAEFVLSPAFGERIVVFHRMRVITDGPTHKTIEGCYGSYQTPRWVFNEDEIRDFFQSHSPEIHERLWKYNAMTNEYQGTYIVIV